jgi:hypothetical protein
MPAKTIIKDNESTLRYSLGSLVWIVLDDGSRNTIVGTIVGTWAWGRVDVTGPSILFNETSRVSYVGNNPIGCISMSGYLVLSSSPGHGMLHVFFGDSALGKIGLLV